MGFIKSGYQWISPFVRGVTRTSIAGSTLRFYWRFDVCSFGENHKSLRGPVEFHEPLSSHLHPCESVPVAVCTPGHVHACSHAHMWVISGGHSRTPQTRATESKGCFRALNNLSGFTSKQNGSAVCYLFHILDICLWFRLETCSIDWHPGEEEPRMRCRGTGSETRSV